MCSPFYRKVCPPPTEPAGTQRANNIFVLLISVHNNQNRETVAEEGLAVRFERSPFDLLPVHRTAVHAVMRVNFFPTPLTHSSMSHEFRFLSTKRTHTPHMYTMFKIWRTKLAQTYRLI